jgi:glyoxylase I family protein
MRGPRTTGIHHFAPTVTDVEKSAAWYADVFGLTRLARIAPHHGNDAGGFAVLLVDERTGLLIGLHEHDTNTGSRFDESRTGLDHVAWGVELREELEDWEDWLTALEVNHSGIIDMADAGYSVIVFRDPDDIQLELFHRHASASGAHRTGERTGLGAGAD